MLLICIYIGLYLVECYLSINYKDYVQTYSIVFSEIFIEITVRCHIKIEFSILHTFLVLKIVTVIVIAQFHVFEIVQEA